MPPGYAIAVQNYESAEDGYARIDGYERYDGRTAPSAASYWIIRFESGSAALTVGATLTGATSGATAKVLVAPVITSGSIDSSNAAGTVVVTALTGTWQDAENIQISSVTVAVMDGDPSPRGAATDALDQTYLRAAIEDARLQIAAVPGSGPIRGVWVFNGTVYAFRDNVGATAGVMWKSSASGWVEQALGRSVAFTSGGSYEINIGDTITGATSGATAVVRRVVLTGGSWGAGTAAGRLILSGQTGNFASENLNVGANSNVATIAGNSTVNTLPAGGRYECINHNFYGASNRRRMYAANGVGTAFEFDGNAIAPILTGMPTDTPGHIAEFRNHLFLSFGGGSVQHSATGDPMSWTPLLGAGEIGIGEDVTGLIGASKTALVILGRNKVAVLYGDDTNNFDLKTLTDDAGAIEWTAQQIGSPHYFDDAGLRSMSTTQSFGDWRIGTITQLIDPFLKSQRKAKVAPIASIRCRAKDQYRLFYADGRGFSVWFGAKNPELMVFKFPIIARTTCSGEDAEGSEIMFFGADNGFVYQLDSGTSFDGEAIEAYIRMAFNACGSPQREKRFHRAAVELTGSAETQLGVTAEFSYADPEQPPSRKEAFSVRGSGGFWNESNWDSFYWSSPVEGIAEASIDGLGRNISVAIISNAIYEAPHTLRGLTLNYTYRRAVR